ncbi:hypothetical protein [Sphingosinicella terrae]|uniref:hypothetical protein n=1 Tax=Sphingosinicella terrae TaxID=2172047 RepID=UPI000E0CDFFB|nr:hypothetical protein [Sphingosinicella terrae]
MANSADILWFKTHFGPRIAQAVQGTVFDVDRLTAIACQETGELWGTMRRKPNLTPDRIAALCCGDTLDADKGRRAFPRTKDDLVAPTVRDGQRMFEIARAALLAMAEHVPAYAFAKTNKRKFAHGFGVFQYDLQFFLTNPAYFLNRDYEDFDKSLARALGELRTGLKTLGLQNRTAITDLEFCKVAICYNTGRFDPSRGLKQGHSDNGKFYGEFIRDFLALSRTVAAPGAPATVPATPGRTDVPPQEDFQATGPLFQVDTLVNALRLRSAARISTPPEANVVAELPDGLMVRSVTGTPVNGFIEVEALLGGKRFRGFASAKFLKAISGAQGARLEGIAARAAAAATIPEASLAHPAGLVTKRSAIAGAHALNEPAMPRRTSVDPAGLRDELAKIIAFLATDNPAHKRYRPRDGLTFCNIYAHDYCMLAGAYLPRVWWTQPALLKIAAGESLTARLGNTVDEVRANDLFRWLRDFGQNFGWRRAASPSELQDHANRGGVGLIVARRKQDGRSGHIVAVVPETATETAKRDGAGKVTMPLQSQAGTVNFRYGRSTPDWWKDARFAESAFWLHA